MQRPRAIPKRLSRSGVVPHPDAQQPPQVTARESDRKKAQQDAHHGSSDSGKWVDVEAGGGGALIGSVQASAVEHGHDAEPQPTNQRSTVGLPNNPAPDAESDQQARCQENHQPGRKPDRWEKHPQDCQRQHGGHEHQQRTPECSEEAPSGDASPARLSSGATSRMRTGTRDSQPYWAGVRNTRRPTCAPSRRAMRKRTRRDEVKSDVD